MEISLPLNEMTTAEKLRTIEVLWNDLLRNPNEVSSPPWHEEVLAERERQIKEGEAKFVPLDEFRQDLQKETQ
ncbi:MAG TPA: addiction module protein [Thermoguttaceae bacterium]|nr:addiction module protein [Thermoguttaceae bacterium]